MTRYVADLVGELAEANQKVAEAEIVRRRAQLVLKDIAFYKRHDGQPGRVLYVKTSKGMVKYLAHLTIPEDDEAEFVVVSEPT